MSRYASKVVEQARAWVGKKESNGTHKEIIDVYNSHKPLARGYKVKYTDAWCSTFVSAVAIKLGYTDIIPTECGCEKHTILFKNKGIWVENENRTPNPGDIIFYDWNDNGSGDNKGSADHVGIVEKVEGSKITVIEGNYDNSVGRRTLSVNGRYIRGYGVPKYDKEVTTQTTNHKFKTHDKIILNGYLYRDSKGNGRGQYRTDYRGTITIIADGSKPYHIDGLGWVSENDIKLQSSITYKTVFNCAWLNLRTSSKYGNNVYKAVKNGTKLEYLGIENGWSKVKYVGKTLFCGSRYLK